jgi:hypothetical protein
MAAREGMLRRMVVSHFASHFRLCQVAGWNGLEVPGMSFMIWTLVRLCSLWAQLLKY